MSPDISERSFEEAIECGLLQQGPDACTGYVSAVHETPAPYGDAPGGNRKRRPEDHDLVLFLNGIPIFTAELKNRLNGQDVEDAMRQYMTARDPREPLLAHRRCLAHFAVDPDLVYVTTQIDGPRTRFLPFNRGKFGGAGNPPVSPTRPGTRLPTCGKRPGRATACSTWCASSSTRSRRRTSAGARPAGAS